jgi:threonine/homoserine/homoserine lactone efflux protein
MHSVFMQGFLTNVLNPKVALFFLAFLPQFVMTDSPSKPLALIFLGVIFDFNGTLWNLTVAWSTARLAGRIAGGATFKIWFDRAVGSLFVVVGLKLMLSREY